MDAYGGFEPQVGQVRALRTLRIGPDGGLYALFSNERWHEGSNTARCALKDSPPHRSPDPDCTCGFYDRDRSRMLADHPPTELDCYEPAGWGAGRPAGRMWWSAAIAAALLGVLPADWLGGASSAAVLWIVLAVAFGMAALPVARRGTDVGCRGRRLLGLGTSMWLFASFLAPFGMAMVRLPLLQAASIVGLQHMCLLLEARRIPADIAS